MDGWISSSASVWQPRPCLENGFWEQRSGTFLDSPANPEKRLARTCIDSGQRSTVSAAKGRVHNLFQKTAVRGVVYYLSTKMSIQVTIQIKLKQSASVRVLKHQRPELGNSTAFNKPYLQIGPLNKCVQDVFFFQRKLTGQQICPSRFSLSIIFDVADRSESIKVITICCL